MSTRYGYLLDASALVNILPLLDVKKFQTSLNMDLFITQLTPFEVGNALWKLYIKRRLDANEVLNLMELMQEFIELKIFNTIQISGFNEIAILALKRKITYYDASYLYLGKNKDLVLITDDSGLRTNAEIENVEAIDTEEFKRRHQELIKST